MRSQNAPQCTAANTVYDAPYALVMFGVMSMASAFVAAMLWRYGLSRAATQVSIYFVFFFSNTASFWFTTRRGKFVEWERILDRLRLSGEERVLDMGCGRGAVLTAVARRVTTGRVTGVDIWSTARPVGERQGRHRAQRVARRRGRSRDVETGDMRALPFPDATFDLVVSSLAIHNIRTKADRRQAVAEGYRVLRPGGRMVMADIRATWTYEDALRTLGASDIERRRLGWRFWWGNPIAGTTSSPPRNRRYADIWFTEPHQPSKSFQLTLQRFPPTRGRSSAGEVP